MNLKGILARSLVAGTIGLSGCGSDWENHSRNGGDSSTNSYRNNELMNLSANYCAQLGGELRILETQFEEHGVCILPDGAELGEWELYCRFNPDSLSCESN